MLCPAAPIALLLLQVLAFGGGLAAVLVKGSISGTAATSTVIVLANSTLTARGTNISGNRAGKGGAIYASWQSKLVVEQQAVLDRNTAEEEGGALYLVAADATVAGSSLNSNVAQKGGGAVYAKFSNLLMASSNLTANTAPIGGAMAVYDQSDVDITDGSALRENAARIVNASLPTNDYYKLGVGGALYVERSNVSIDHSTVAGNRAVMDGGGLWEQAAVLCA